MQTGGFQAAGCSLIEHAACLTYLSVRRRGAALGNAGTEFHAVGAALLSSDATFHAVGADFEVEPTPQTPTPSPSRGEGSLISIGVVLFVLIIHFIRL